MSDYKQWAVGKNAVDIAYNCIELYHPDIGSHYYVNNQQFDKQFTLPANAPRNANTLTTFEPLGFVVERPSSGKEPVVSLDVTMGRVGSEMKKKLEQVDLMEFGELVYWVFLNGAAKLQLRLQIADITLEDNAVLIRAEQENPTFRDISEIYTADRFPGLRVF